METRNPNGLLFVVVVVYSIVLGIVVPTTVFYSGMLENIPVLLWSNNIAWGIVAGISIVKLHKHMST